MKYNIDQLKELLVREISSIADVDIGDGFVFNQYCISFDDERFNVRLTLGSKYYLAPNYINRMPKWWYGYWITYTVFEK